MNQYEAVLYFETGDTGTVAMIRISCSGENHGSALHGLLHDWPDAKYTLDRLVQAVITNEEPSCDRNLLAHRP